MTGLAVGSKVGWVRAQHRAAGGASRAEEGGQQALEGVCRSRVRAEDTAS